MTEYKPWREQPIRVELRDRLVVASFVDNGKQAEAAAAVEALIPEQYKATARRGLFPFNHATWDFSDVLHTGLAFAGWAQ